MKKIKNRKIILKIGILIVLLIIILPALQTFAQNDYTVLAPLPGTLKVGTGWQTDLQTYLPGVFKLLIGLSAVFAVLMIVIGGFQYMFTDALSGKTAGRERIKNAIYGLVLVIGAWLILWTINPNLLTLNLNIESASVNAPAGGGQLISPDQIKASCPNCVINPAVPINLTPANLARLSCTTCVPMTGIPTNGNMQSNATPSMKQYLIDLYVASSNLGFKVSEGYPPVVNHKDSCHYSGTCVDVTISGKDAASINKLISNANTVGFKPYYEVANDERKQELVNAGVPAANILPNGNAEHFHLEK